MDSKNLILRKHKGGIISFVVFLVVVTIFASGAIAVYTIFIKPENKSVVPQLVGSSTVEAVSEAEYLGLVVQIESVASTMPEGRVLAQSPQAGENLRKGQVIVLQVSQGGELHPIPDVKGKVLAEAQDDIKEQGFALGDVIKISEPNIKPGTVIAQSPAAPANVASGRKIDLLVQAGTPQAENIAVPDVNRMTEDEARNVLETAGVKIQGVERVYSPLVPEGLAIETKPGAGTLIKPGQGVVLKFATQKRPAGFSEAASKPQTPKKGNGTVTAPRSTAANPANTKETKEQKSETQSKLTPAQNPERSAKVSAGGDDNVFIGDDYDVGQLSKAPKNAQTQPSKPAAASQSSTKPQANTQQKPAAPASAPAASNSNSSQSAGGSKTARIRYQVPPLARPMELKIEVTDPSGTRNVMSRQVRSGESINTTASYSQECIIKIYLGGEAVWQERQR